MTMRPQFWASPRALEEGISASRGSEVKASLNSWHIHFPTTSEFLFSSAKKHTICFAYLEGCCDVCNEIIYIFKKHLILLFNALLEFLFTLIF